MTMRTPLKSARHLGSAKEGADHFWLQRVTAVANVILGLVLVWLLVRLSGASHDEVVAMVSNPLVALALLLLVISTAIHMRLGLQVIIEDYVHHDGAKLALLIGNTFVAVAVAAISIYSVLKLNFGG